MGKLEKVAEIYFQRYKSKPLIVKSPGRINLLGEHVDYNGGTVLPAAIDRYIYLAIGKRDDSEVRIYASDFQDECTASISDLKPAWKLWPNYILGAIDEFRKYGKDFTGLNIVVGGDIPLAAGLSSSAALSCAAAFAINELFDWNFTRLDLARIAQRAENTFVGVQCGLMDQFGSLFGKEKNFIKLNCDTFDYEYVPFESESHHFVLFDSGVKHHLISSEYNKRREECAQGLEVLKAQNPAIRTFADLTEEQILAFKDELPLRIFNRCLYVVQELNRVEQVCDALKKADYDLVGKLMFETHSGLKDLYEVSCTECDFLVEFAQKAPSILGARMMGAGFGGCTINLVEKTSSELIINQAKAEYKASFGKELKVYIAAIGAGTSLAEVSEAAFHLEVEETKTDFTQVYPKPKV